MFLHKPFNAQTAHKTVGHYTNTHGTTKDVSKEALTQAAHRASKAAVTHDNEVK